MKRLFKIALTISLSSVALLALGSHEAFGAQAKTIHGEHKNNSTQKYSPAETKILALNTNSAEKFGDEFLKAWKSGKSSNFIPNKVDLDQFLYAAFGSEYMNLSIQEKNKSQFGLFDSLKVLHTSPTLIRGYKQMIFKKRGISKIGDDYIYSFTSQIVGHPIREGAIRIKEANGQLLIIDIKSNYWLTSFMKENFSSLKGKVSIGELMNHLANSYRRQFGT
jgi:hypothetical protein